MDNAAKPVMYLIGWLLIILMGVSCTTRTGKKAWHTLQGRELSVKSVTLDGTTYTGPGQFLFRTCYATIRCLHKFLQFLEYFVYT